MRFEASDSFDARAWSLGDLGHWAWGAVQPRAAVDLALDELGFFAIGMSLQGGTVAQSRTKVRHGHRAQVCHWLDEGSPWLMAELEVEEEEEEERGQVEEERTEKWFHTVCGTPSEPPWSEGDMCTFFQLCTLWCRVLYNTQEVAKNPLIHAETGLCLPLNFLLCISSVVWYFFYVRGPPSFNGITIHPH